MSTKIYYGMRSQQSLTAVYGELLSFREKYIRRSENKTFSFSKFFKLPPETQSRIEAQVFRSSIILTPLQGCVLAYPYFGDWLRGILHDLHKKDWFEEFCSLTSFSPYGYWDNTDQPDDVSDYEWGRRCEDWDAVVKDYRPMIFQGLSFELSDEFDFMTDIAPKMKK